MKLSPNEVVRDSYNHFTCDLGVLPSAADLFEDIRDNYAGYSHIDDTMEMGMSFIKFIEDRCLREELELKED